jgi:hypothetical protein
MRAILCCLRRTFGVLALAAFCAGCKAHMMETRGDLRLARSGLEKPDRGGVIRYLANGPASFKTARRADAEKQMRKFCGGPFTITAEGPRSKFGAAMPVASKVSLGLDEYWYVAFDCPRTPAP